MARARTTPRRLLAAMAAPLALAVSMGACAQPTVGDRGADVDDRYVAQPAGLKVESWAQGLAIPWEIAFLPKGGALVTERAGTIRRLGPDGTVRDKVYARLDVRHRGEGGLMGLALHPDFPDRPWVYVMYTADTADGAVNRIARLRHQGASAGAVEIVLDGIPAARNHNGGRLAFGPDGLLYATAGENFRRRLAQQRDSLAGKILRLTPEGETAPGNPFDSYVYSWGHRNPQGLAWHPDTGDLFASEHGPSGEVGVGGAYDEVNVIAAGGNYGWPQAIGAPGVEPFIDPLIAWPENAVPPAGLAFWQGDLYMAALGAEALVRLSLERESGATGPSAYTVAAVERLFADGPYSGTYGRLRAVTVGPDGALYVGTSNRDGRGSPRSGDDKILRIEQSSR